MKQYDVLQLGDTASSKLLQRLPDMILYIIKSVKQTSENRQTAKLILHDRIVEFEICSDVFYAL